MKIASDCSDAAFTRLAVEGGMTIYEADGIKQHLLAALDAGAPLVVDLSRVDEIDTAGLQVLVLAQREAVRLARPWHVAARSAAVEEVLQRYGLGDTFDPPADIVRDVAALAQTIASERNSREP